MKSVVLLSGGLDSAVLLAHIAAQECAEGITAVTFDYNQTHIREIDHARLIAKHYGVRHEIIELPQVFGHSALQGHTDIPEHHADEPDATTVPARNLVMLAIGASVAAQLGAAVVFIGANADDASGYLDCRDKFIESMNTAVMDGTRYVTISAPYLSWSKAQIVTLGEKLGVPMHLTWSCYRGAEQPCGRCGACESREKALA